MVRNTILEEEGSVQSKLKEAIFEPKMTRSKLREVMGNGQMPVSVHMFGKCFLLGVSFHVLRIGPNLIMASALDSMLSSPKVKVKVIRSPN